MKHVEGSDAVSQSEVMWANLVDAGLRTSDGSPVRECVEAAMAAVSRLLACANPDGGFGLYEGMESSPTVTAAVLERFAVLRDRGLLDVVSEEMGEDALDALDYAVISAVRYLDFVCVCDNDRPAQDECISPEQYQNIRSMYLGVPLK